MVEKTFIDANELLLDSYRLARKIFDDGYRPDYVVGVWRGGCPIGVAVEDLFFVVSGRLGYLTDVREVRARAARVYAGSEVPRTVEYYPALDLLKYKANAEARAGEQYEYI